MPIAYLKPLDLIKTREIPLRALAKTPDYHPSIELLTNLTINEMHQVHLNQVSYDTFSDTIIKLTFGFGKSQKVWKLSPPQNTYPVEPKQKYDIPADQHIGCIQIGKNKY